MQALPSGLIKLRVLGAVPISEYAELAPPQNASNTEDRLSFFRRLRQSKPSPTEAENTTSSRYVSFNAALWMSFANAPDNPVSLWLSYSDVKGQHSVLIDEHSFVDTTSAMLAGEASFKVWGRIRELKVCCGGVKDHERFRVDEFHVKRNSNTDNEAARLKQA